MKKNNLCTICNNRYYRRNLTELWTVRNPGHHKGWVKDVQKACLACISVSRATRILNVAQVSFEKPSKREKVTA